MDQHITQKKNPDKPVEKKLEKTTDIPTFIPTFHLPAASTCSLS